MMTSNRQKVVVAMSGGVDSSVAAALLLQDGYEVIGVFMRLGTPQGVQLAKDPHGRKQGCCSVLDADDARRVAQTLNIPFYVLNFEEDFGRVINYFVDEYNRGRTPNPCVRCNDWLKFGKLHQYAAAVGANYVASGHYARRGIDPATGESALLRAVDEAKDQSDVLFGMSRAVLDQTLFPIGDFLKTQVRQMAEGLSLPVFSKPDSQEICFVPDQDYAGLLRRRSPESIKQGELVSTSGQVIGAHEGHQNFTIGQRKGVGLALGHPVYVVDIDAQANRVVLGEKEQLLKRSLVADGVNILSARLNVSLGEIHCRAKIRHRHEAAPAVASIDAEGKLHVRFDEPQSAITPGQAVILYDGDLVLGGGWIAQASDGEPANKS